MTDARVENELEERRDDYATRRFGIAALASDSVIYGGTRALLKSLSFLLVPLVAHYVSPAEIGRLAIVLALVAIMDVFITAGMGGVFARFYFDRDEEGWRRQIITLYMLIETVYPALIVVPLISLSGSLSDRIFGVETYASFFVIALIDVYLTNIVDMPMNLTRMRRRRKRLRRLFAHAWADADPAHDPARCGLAPRRQGHPDRLAGRRLRRNRGHAAGVRLRPHATGQLASRPRDDPLRLAGRHRRRRVLRDGLPRPVLRPALPR